MRSEQASEPSSSVSQEGRKAKRLHFSELIVELNRIAFIASFRLALACLKLHFSSFHGCYGGGTT